MAIKKTNIYVAGQPDVINLSFGGLNTTTEVTSDTKHTWYKITGRTWSTNTSKISFTTTQDNVKISFKIKASSEFYNDYVYLTGLDAINNKYDNNGNRVSGNGEELVADYTVPNAGDHYIYIGYTKDNSTDEYNDCGYVCCVSDLNAITLKEIKSVYAENSKVQQMNINNKNLFEYGYDNTISWETLTWDKSSNSYTYNTNGPIKMYYKTTSSSGTSITTLNTSPSKLPLNGKVYKLDFYPSIISNNIYVMPYKIDLSNWDTSYVHDMGNMFYNFNSLNSINLSTLTNENITSTQLMFYGCKNLTTLDVSGFNTSNVTNMYCMFYSCENLTTLDVSGFNTSKVINMGWMFGNCYLLKSLDVSNWNTNNVTDMNNMFTNCENLTTLDVSGFNTSNVTDMNSMFYSCENLTTLDVSGFNTSNVTDMHYMFCFCKKLTTLDVSGFNTSNVTDMSNMFRACSSLTSLDVSGWNTSNVTNMSKMIWGLDNITSLDVSKWDVSKVTNMDYMFSSCISLESLDLSRWNVSKVTSAENILAYSGRLKTIIAGHESEPNVTALNGLKLSINLGFGKNLNYESVYALFRGVATVTTTQTITLPSVMEGKLDADKVKIATDKGWTIKYS